MFENEPRIVVIHYEDGSKYEGEIKQNRIRNGVGKMTYKDGSYYNGEWKNGRRHGKGTMKYCEDNALNMDFYYGDWVNDNKDGIGVVKWLNGTIFRGCWRNNEILGSPFY